MATTGDKSMTTQTATPTSQELSNPQFWQGKENGITDSNGLNITPYYSVFVDGELIKHHGVMDNYPYNIALQLAKPYPNASIEVTAYSRKLI